MKRCGWSNTTEMMVTYHDTEWGVPKTSDSDLFEMLVLGGAQAGLSWSSVLKRRQSYQKAFANFDPVRVARFSPAKVESLLENPGIIRNRQKIGSAVVNAKAVVAVQKEFGSFSSYLWQFVEGTPVQNRWKTLSDLPTETDQSVEMSRCLKARGFSFVGPVICYAFMQSVGMVNDHVVGCFRWREVKSTKLGI